MENDTNTQEEIKKPSNEELEAIKVIQEANKKKIEECSKEIGEVLQKYNCDLVAGMLITAQGNRQIVEIVAKQ